MHKATGRHNRFRSDYDLQSDFDHIKEALAEASHDVRGRMGELLTQSMADVKSRSIDARDTLADYVAEKPLKSLGIAMLIGVLLGFFFRK